MRTVRIPAKKVIEPEMSLNDIKNIWDYMDFEVEEEGTEIFGNNDGSSFGDVDDFDDGNS